MLLLVLVMLVGIEEPQAFSTKVVPSASVILRWSLQFVVRNAVNCNIITNPSWTCIFSVIARLFG